jgi:hypothetical protein
MYSLSYLYQSLGDRFFADRAELAAYNALPAMLVPNWWAHQYVAETNQPISHQLGNPPFWNVNNWGQTFGLEPNYPCCTVNHPQGYPKFISNSFVRNGDNGIAHALLSPGFVEATTNTGTQVSITSSTNYPFSYTFEYTVSANAPFTFSVRVPLWATSGSVAVNGGSASPVSPNADTGLHDISLQQGSSTIEYTLSTDVRAEPRANETVSIYHGTLLYSIPINASVTTSSSNYAGAPSDAVQYEWDPTSPWNYAIDPTTLTYNAGSLSSNDSLPNPIWTLNAPPVTISAMVCQIDWSLTDDGYAPNPPLPGSRNCTGDPFEVQLVPYGSAKLHIAEIPTVSLPASNKKH